MSDQSGEGAGRPAAVTVVGSDRPGIVAAVTKVLLDHGCNLEDVTSTILRGHFSMVLIVNAPLDTSVEDLEAALVGATAPMELVVTVRPVDPAPVRVASSTHVVSVYGADRPGIVWRVADALAGAGANITDLTSRLVDPGGEPVYALMLDVSAHGGVDVEGVLARLSGELDVEVSVHAAEVDVL